VVELRKEYGLGFNVWFQPIGGDYADELGRIHYNNQWSVPSQAMEFAALLSNEAGELRQGLVQSAVPCRVRAGGLEGRQGLDGRDSTRLQIRSASSLC
jgi:hypothetical protein